MGVAVVVQVPLRLMQKKKAGAFGLKSSEGNRSVQLNWLAANDAVSYKLYWSEINTGTFKVTDTGVIDLGQVLVINTLILQRETSIDIKLLVLQVMVLKYAQMKLKLL